MPAPTLRLRHQPPPHALSPVLRVDDEPHDLTAPTRLDQLLLRRVHPGGRRARPVGRGDEDELLLPSSNRASRAPIDPASAG